MILQERYREHTQFHQTVTEKIKGDAIEYPISHEVLTDLSGKIENIFNGLLSLGQNNNLYACYILYRSILEHFYRGFFLVDSFTRTKKDETSEHFKVHYFLSEFLAEQMGLLEMEDLIKEAKSKTNFLEYIRAKFPSLQEFDKNNQKEISEAIRKFSLKEITASLRNSFSDGKTDKTLGNFFTKVLPEYSMCSTFTHGGSYGTKIIARHVKADSIEKEIQRILEISFTCMCLTKENVLLTYKLNPQNFLTYIKEFQAIRSRNT